MLRGLFEAHKVLLMRRCAVRVCCASVPWAWSNLAEAHKDEVTKRRSRASRAMARVRGPLEHLHETNSNRSLRRVEGSTRTHFAVVAPLDKRACVAVSLRARLLANGVATTRQCALHNGRWRGHG